MPVCLSHTSALNFFRAAGASNNDISSLPRTGKLDECGATNIAEALATNEFPLYLTPPIHVLVKGRSHSHAKEHVTRHACHTSLTNRSLVRVTDDLFVVSPELCAIQLCASLPELDAALGIFELCGTYSLPPNASCRPSAARNIASRQTYGFGDDAMQPASPRTAEWGFSQRATPLTSCKKISSFADTIPGTHGLTKLRTLLTYILDDSASPMETAMALMIAGPPRIGGMGFKGAVLNRQVHTADGERRVDLLWPQYKFGLEYQGFDSHEGWANRVKDDRRRNAIAAKGIEIASVYYQDLANPYYFDKLIASIAKIIKKRIRITTTEHQFRQMTLRKAVLPPVAGI